MTEIVLRGTGGPETLVVRAGVIPVPGDGQVLIRSEAAGVAFNDVTTRQGRNPGAAPRVLGFDVVGRIMATGAGVSEYAVGQRVAALVGVGGYSTHVLADPRRVVPVPEDIEAPVLDALVLNYVTAWQMLNRVAYVRPGQRILVLGAAGGVGSALCELAILQGAEVFGTSSAGRRRSVEESGVRWVSTPSDVPDKVDAAFDPVGGPSLAETRRATAATGIVVSYGFSFAVDADRSKLRGLLQAASAIARAKLTVGARLRVYRVESAVAKDPASYREDFATLVQLLVAGKIRPTVTTMPLSAAAEAHLRLERREVTGKLVLVP